MLILASASPRRKEILGEIIKDFTIIPSNCDEVVKGNLPIVEKVKDIAYQKAKGVYEEQKGKYGEDLFVLGSDTVVVLDGKIFGKPKDEENAKEMLKLLSNKTHYVYTGVVLLNRKYKYTVYEKTAVKFKELSEEIIEKYVKTGSPMDKAGAYGIQDGFDLVESYTGSYTNIVGLPKEKVEKILKETGVI